MKDTAAELTGLCITPGISKSISKPPHLYSEYGNMADLHFSVILCPPPLAHMPRVLRESSCQCRVCEFSPWPQRVPHAPQRPRPCANYWAHVSANEAHAPESPFSTTREATAMRSPSTIAKNSSCSPQPEKAHKKQWRPRASKRNKINK